MRLSIAFPNPDKRPKSAYSPQTFQQQAFKGGTLPAPDVPDNPFPFQINTTGRHC